MSSPTPGIYASLPAPAYHRWPLPSNSLLNHLARSPLHCRHAMDHPAEQTADMLIGEAFHTHLLEHDQYARRFSVAGQCEAEKRGADRCTNPGKLLVSGRWMCGVHAPKGFEPAAGSAPVLSPEVDAELAAMHAAVMGQPWCRQTLALSSLTEASIVFDDPATGVRCKMRADRIVTDERRPCIIDLKTTRDASPTEFARTIHARGYHRQAAMYLRGCQAVGIDVSDFVIIAIEKDAPYGVAVHQLDEEYLALGDVELTGLLNLYADCVASGRWPGYGDAVQSISPPRWALASAGVSAGEA